MEYTINFFHNLDYILKGTHLRLVFVAIIGFAIFMKGIRHVINDFPVLVSYYKRAKREGYTDFQFFINNAHNIGMYLLVLFATVLSAYAIYFSAERINTIQELQENTVITTPKNK